MLTNKDIWSEVEAMEAVREGLKSEYEKAMLKSSILQVKLLHNLRTNMVAVMKKLGVALVEPKQTEEKVS